jgi:Flp pilus assembly protein TadG
MRTHHMTAGTQRRGTAATEFAITVPLLIVLALGAADFGRVFHFREAVSNAARVGAQAAASRGFSSFTRNAWESDVQDSVIEELQNLPSFVVDDAVVEIAVTGDGSELFDVAVDVSYPFHTIVAWPVLPQSILINARVAMRRSR